MTEENNRVLTLAASREHTMNPLHEFVRAEKEGLIRMLTVSEAVPDDGVRLVVLVLVDAHHVHRSVSRGR